MLVNNKNYRTVWMEGSSVFMIEQNLLPFEFKIPAEESHKGQRIITADIIFDDIKLGPLPDLMVNSDYKPPDFLTAWNPKKKQNLLIWINNTMNQSKNLFK